MDRDEEHNLPGEKRTVESEFQEEGEFEDTSSQAYQMEDAARQEEWDHQPLDEFEQGQPQDSKADPFDDAGPLEDEYHGDEGDLEEAGNPSAHAPIAGAKQSSSGLMKYLPYIGGGLAAVLVAFFGFQQFMGSSEPIAQQAPEHQNTWDANTQNNNVQNAQPAPNEFQQPVAQPAPQPVVPEAIPQPVAQVVAPAPLPTAVAPNPLETRIAELTQQIETMRQTQEQLNQKVQTVAATPQQPAVDETSRAASKALEDRIAQLEQRIANQPAAAPAPAHNADFARPVRRNAEQATVEPKPRRAKKGSTDFMAVKKSRTARKQQRSVDTNVSALPERFAPVNRPYLNWVLRSAQPGSAWLSEGPNSSDLRRVVPGDKVQGLGTITSIRQVAGRWVVEGTQGAVR
ncbi:MAG: hypothetical protein EB059_04205 [Alphaproteobacteria bacterium]|nr:hypothetical protein [Alphaproteobacteria bacterium]